MVGYPLSHGAVRYAMEYTGITRVPLLANPIRIAMVPALHCGKHVPFIRTIHTESWFVLRDLFGSPGPPDATHAQRPQEVYGRAIDGMSRETDRIRQEMARLSSAAGQVPQMPGNGPLQQPGNGPQQAPSRP